LGLYNRAARRRMSQDDVTGWLVAWGKGDPAANSRLMEAVYVALRRVARRRLGAERGDHSLTPTALVHEAYVRLVDLRRVRWQNRIQFFAIAARVMRRVLVDHARGHAALKRGGARCRVSLSDQVAVTPARDMDLLDLDAALDKLGTINPRLIDLVVMRFFGGLTIEETAEAVQSSPATVKRDWIRARAWLFRELSHQVAARAPGTMTSLLAWMEQNLSRELPLPAIARRAAMSTRTLSRRFREQVGATPAAWLAHARVRRAQRLLETTDLAIEQVAAESGFGSAAVMREHFGTVVGTSPLSYRRAFSKVDRSA
jgi:RNA polymerase sigma factor (TIGR02999 family)